MQESDFRAFFEHVNQGRFEEVGNQLAEDVVFEFPGHRFGTRASGKRRVMVFLRQNQRLFEDGLRFHVEWVGVMGDRAVVEWQNAGTTRTGLAYANRGVTLFTFRDGQIQSIRDYLDTERIAATWPTG